MTLITLTKLSHPPETNRFGGGLAMWLPGSSMRAPGATDGPQETALQPIVCALEIFFASHVEPSALPVRMDIEPSLRR